MSETKTAGQVLAEADGVTYYHAPGKIYDRQREDWERRAQAVIEWHEAQRPAWPAMRPMAEAKGTWIMIRVLDRDELGPRPVRIRISEDRKHDYWEDLLSGEWYSETEIQGWWPLPEVLRWCTPPCCQASQRRRVSHSWTST